MKKLFTLAVTMLLAGTLSFAQTGGSTDKPAGTTKTDSGKKGKSKGKKGGKKSKKGQGTTAPATPAPK